MAIGATPRYPLTSGQLRLVDVVLEDERDVSGVSAERHRAERTGGVETVAAVRERHHRPVPERESGQSDVTVVVEGW
jgi:hypothetical protein